MDRLPGTSLLDPCPNAYPIWGAVVEKDKVTEDVWKVKSGSTQMMTEKVHPYSGLRIKWSLGNWLGVGMHFCFYFCFVLFEASYLSYLLSNKHNLQNIFLIYDLPA